MTFKSSLYFFCLIGLITIFQSCKKEYDSIESTDDRKIQEYISKNGLTMTKDPSGFYYQIISNGSGAPLQNKDSVFFTFNYTSLSGIVYTKSNVNSNSGTFVGYLSNKYSAAFPGEAFRIMMNKINRGGSFKVIVPSYLAFGKNGVNNIPGNEVLLSEVNVFDEDSQTKVDDARIQKFLKDKGLTANKYSNGIYYIINNLGTDGEASTGASAITAKYTGRLLDGTEFDKTVGANVFTGSLNGAVILGWATGLRGYKAGTKIRLFIPSAFGYGIIGKDPIPPNAVLDFDIELVTVTN